MILQRDFDLSSPFQPAGDQPTAIDAVVRGFKAGKKFQTLLGVTGSGKTFVMANVIKELGIPTLILSHNKTLTAQLFGEFRQFYPHNAIEYFVSYYDYYQPEAYLPATDVYIEKDSAINDSLDRLRLSSTSALMTRNDVVVVASVSCIYGIGNPEEYGDCILTLTRGAELDRQDALERLVAMQYQRNDYDFKRGTFRVRGDVLEVWPAYLETAIRVELFGTEIDEITEISPLTADVVCRYPQLVIFPATHFVLNPDQIDRATESIEDELEQRVTALEAENKLLEVQRIKSRTHYDLEMIREIGYCKGIENYSRHFDGRKPGERPTCLFDYFMRHDKWLLIVDESHVTLPQIRGMYNGDQARKKVLVDHGFRLPSALDNRPMTWDEFLSVQPPTLYVSATPAPYELAQTSNEVVELLVRPTGLVDPPVEIRPTQGQVHDIMLEIQKTAEKGQRTLITALTKRLSEELDDYCRQRGLKTAYLHSDVKTIDRVEILKKLRLGSFDALIGVNLLREGLDLPEVSLVVILDADKEGFLRSATSLIQTIGRCARNVDGRVILYADRITDAMQKTMDETSRRRTTQLEYNRIHNITPTTAGRAIETGMEEFFSSDEAGGQIFPALGESLPGLDKAEEIRILQEEMQTAAEEMRFEDAGRLRDRLLELGVKLEYNPEEGGILRQTKGRQFRGRGKKGAKK